MHYVRIPRAYWRARLKMAKAMGLNTISTYVFWNEHEPRPGEYDFSGNNDVAEFIREAQEEGLYVILRPGPYVCAEWEFGAFPSWLLKDHSLLVRSTDPKFLAASRSWLTRLGQELAPLQIANGGPIILIQVENEYRLFATDPAYMQQIHRIFVDAGFTAALLYTADGPEKVLPGLLPAVNFAPGQSRVAFATCKRLRPQGPFFSAEYWDGWFDHWGGAHANRDVQTQVADLDWTLRQGYSINLYMFHGGTSFGWMNGANSNGRNYVPDVTSYDYDSPLDESGRPTAKYFLFRDTIASATGTTPPAVPQIAPPITIPWITLPASSSLWDNLPAPVHSDEPLSMEDLDQSYGYILYRTNLTGPVKGDLVLDQLHDYAQVYLDGKLAGTLDRRLHQNTLPLNITEQNVRLDILVENTGRINFSKALQTDRKGITKQVTLNGTQIAGWNIYPLPMLAPNKLSYSSAACYGPCFYRAAFNVEKAADTFLDTSAFTKGEVWINGHALGRVWNVGPQKTLYLPGPWLKSGENEVIVFDLESAPGRSLQGLDHPVLDAAITK
ncbi:beta-galactosidase [Alloacidobacterium dinghuense]|uniref:Beta-galactosidase n=2 Tax=Alloacidobacterium dinghuense TaxID=2763107 RepID=A0A7G8BRD2_9BACT|nr:beta-galactosidase [Alloacidobacterium dinghuense]